MSGGLPKYIQVVNGIPYFRRVKKVEGNKGTTRHRMPALESPEFAIMYQELLHGSKGVDTLTGSMSSLIAEYRKSDEYKALKASTKYHRDRYLDMIEADHGRKAYVTLTRGKVKEIRSSMSETPGKANNYMSTLSSLCKCAVELEWVVSNPCAGLRPMPLGEHQPWPEDALEKALKIAEPMTRLAMVLHLYTGQRIGDVCMMHRGSIKDGTIEVIQEKTGKTVWIPIHSRLREELAKDQTPHVKWLLYNSAGTRMRPRTLQHCLADLRVSYKEKYDEDLPWVWHGFRKNAVNALLEAGCTPSQVAAITGQTLKMIEHYSKKVNTRKLAIEAVKKWEQA